MAKRESQGMQITVILLVMLSVLFAITTIVFWNMSKNAKAEAEAKQQQASEADQRVNRTITENQNLRRMLGHAEDEDFASVEKIYNDDMLKFGPSFPKENQNYRKLPEYLTTINQQLHGELSTASTRVKELETELASAKKEKEKHVGIERAAKVAAEEEYRTEREKLTAELTEQKTAQQQLRTGFERKRTELAAQNRQLESKIRELERELDAVNIKNDRNARELAQLKTETFENPDGKVTWVNQTGESVYVNLGSEDGLHRQVSFSIYDVDENGLARAEKKASIEVTKVLGRHLAEARVIDSKPTNPIVSGDIIFSPIWEVGNPVRFALTGLLDFDKDGRSDRTLIRRMIARNGAVIDAEVDKEGNREGDISVQTRYLVVGERFSPSTKGGDADSRIRADAKSLGVQTISLDRLLSDLGYRKVSKTIAMGKRASEKDYRKGAYDPRPVYGRDR